MIASTLLSVGNEKSEPFAKKDMYTT